MKKLLLFCLLASVPAFGQAYSSSVTQNSPGNYGRPVPYATVLVCGVTDTAVPCTTKVPTFTTQTLTTQCSSNAGSGVLTGAPTSGTNCNNPGIADINGNFTIYVAPGQYMICTYANNWLCQPQSIASGPTTTFNCVGALNGSIMATINPTTASCDPNMGTDFAGNGFAQSWKYLGPVNGFFGLIGGAPDPGTLPAYKLNTHEMRFLAALSGNSYYARVPGTHCAVGQVWNVTNTTTDANGDTVDTYGCLTPGTGSGSVTSVSQGLGITNTPNPITATGSVAMDGATQIGTPATPTLTVNGVTGATTYTYLVVGCENPSCSRHTAVSSTQSVANGNATLSSSNSITLTGYGDTLYGVRGYLICRTVGGATQGIITSGLLAGKAFTDTGLTGDGTNCASIYASNNTVLLMNMAALPGCNIPYEGIIGQDAPQCSTTAYDSEFGETFGGPGDVNNTTWTKNANYNSAIASWSNGALVFKPDTGAFFEYLEYYKSLPVAPYTFTAYIDQDVYGNTTEGDSCFLGLRESSTGKMEIINIYRRQNVSDITAGGGTMLLTQNLPSDTWTSTNLSYMTYFPHGFWLQLQVSGGNVITSYSSDGIVFAQTASQALTVPFTTAPNQLIVGGSGRGGGTTGCMVDWIRRTQ